MLPGRRLALGLATLITLSSRAPAQEPRGPRGQIEMLEAAIDRAVGQVSHPSSRFLFGAAEARGYRLKGYGAVFVLPPRALPLPRHVLVFRGETKGRSAALGRVDETTAEASRRRGERDRELKAIEDQVEAFQREAEAARREAERAFEEMVRQMRERARPAAPHSAATRSPESAPAPAAAPAPPPPAAPSAVAAAPPLAPPRSLLPPPWAFWFETGSDRDERAAEGVIRDVGAAIQTALEAEGPHLSMLDPDEFVVVVVDFVSPEALVAQARPDHTLVVRVRKKDLDERRAGRIDSQELGRRIEVAEY